MLFFAKNHFPTQNLLSDAECKICKNRQNFKCLKLSYLRAIFADNMLFFTKNHFPTQNLLSDAEIFEDVLEDFVRGNLCAGDFGKDIENLTEIFAEKVATHLHIEAIDNAMQ